METPPPIEQRRESMVSDLSASDVSDLQTALRTCVVRIIRDGPTRSVAGSTDREVDVENWCKEITDLFRRFASEIAPVNRAEEILSPLREEYGNNEKPHVYALEEKVREVKEGEEKLKKENRELKREIKDLRKENNEVEKLEDARKALTEENEKLGEDAAEAREEAQSCNEKLLKVRKKLIEEKERADENKKKIDGIHGMIAEKRREFEEERVKFETDRKELEMYRRGRDEPALRALLLGTSRLADQWLNDREEEEELITKIQGLHQPSHPPDPESPKTPEQEHAEGPTAVEGSVQRSPFSAGTPGGPDAVERSGPRGTTLEDELKDGWQDEDQGSETMMAWPVGGGDEPRADYGALVAENDRLRSVEEELLRQIRDLKAQIIEEQENGDVETPVAFPRFEEIRRLEAEIARLNEQLESTANAATENKEWNALREWERRCGESIRRAEEADAKAVQTSPEEVTIIPSDGLSEAQDRIRELEGVIIAQLDFHRDVQPLLTATGNLTTKVHVAESELVEGAFGLDGVLRRISRDDDGDDEATEAWEARMQEFRGREEHRRERGQSLFGLWGELERVRGRLEGFIGGAREQLDDDALRLGIKVRNPLFFFNIEKPPRLI